MALYLVQHGRSASKEADPERGLTREGAAEVERMAAALGDAAVRLDAIVHSGKTRAAQTAALLAARLHPGSGVSMGEGLGPLDDVVAFARGLDARAERLYVGHLPFMERLVSHLLGIDPERRAIRFQNGGVVCLEHDPAQARWELRWALVPNLRK